MAVLEFKEENNMAFNRTNIYGNVSNSNNYEKKYDTATELWKNPPASSIQTAPSIIGQKESNSPTLKSSASVLPSATTPNVMDNYWNYRLGIYPYGNIFPYGNNGVYGGSGNNYGENAGTANTGSSSSASSSVSTGNPYGNYANQLQSLYNQQMQNLNNYQQQQKAAAQNAYNNNMSALMNAYNSRMSNLDSSLQNAKEQLQGYYDNSKRGIESDSARALQEAYINKMLSQKNLQQQLTAQGISGGASESAIAGLINNYGNARNEIDTTKNNNLADLEQNYNSNLADVLNNYYNARNAADESKLSYQMQLENALANNTVSSFGNLYDAMANLDSSYINAMQNALANQAAYQAKANTASNTVNSVDTSNAGINDSTVNYVKNQIRSGRTQDEIIMELGENGYGEDDIYQILKNAGLAVE